MARYVDDFETSSGRKAAYEGEPEVDSAIFRVRLAIAESDRRNSMPRSKASDTSKMNKVFKPKASPGPVGSSANVREGRSPDRSPKPNRANAREDRATKPKSNVNSNVRENRVATKSKATPKSKNTSFNKSGVAGVLRSPEAKKFRDTFNKKGLIPALRGK